MQEIEKPAILSAMSDSSDILNTEEEFSKKFDITSCGYPDFADVNVFTAYSNSRLVNTMGINAFVVG